MSEFTATDTDSEEYRPPISADDLTDAQIERVLNTPLFQKGLAYSKLADGIASPQPSAAATTTRRSRPR